jgi:hypothetical protein
MKVDKDADGFRLRVSHSRQRANVMWLGRSQFVLSSPTLAALTEEDRSDRGRLSFLPWHKKRSLVAASDPRREGMIRRAPTQSAQMLRSVY